MKITNKQKEILAAIKDLSLAKRIPPTLNEIKEYLGYKNTSSVQRHTDSLKKKGALLSDEHKSRSLRIRESLQKMVSIPLVGNVACGKPILAVQDIEAYIPYERSKIRGNYQDYFFLRAAGTSMNRAGINSGDFVLIKRQNYADFGQRVVALIGDEATIKIFKKKDNVYVLEPKSTDPTYKPIYIKEEAMIQGIVEDVIKNK